MRKKTVDMIPLLSEHMKEILTSFSKSRSFPVSLSKRATIILLASEGGTQTGIFQVGWEGILIVLLSGVTAF